MPSGPLLESIKFKSNKFSNFKIFLKNNLKDINKNWPKKLPKGVIHGDLFIDNIFFKKNKLSGIIDFYFAANDYFMYEIAICINALCFDHKKKKFHFLNVLTMIYQRLCVHYLLKKKDRY